MNENIAFTESTIPIIKIGIEKLSAINGAIGRIIENPIISIKTAIHSGDKFRYLKTVNGMVILILKWNNYIS